MHSPPTSDHRLDAYTNEDVYVTFGPNASCKFITGIAVPVKMFTSLMGAPGHFRWKNNGQFPCRIGGRNIGKRKHTTQRVHDNLDVRHSSRVPPTITAKAFNSVVSQRRLLEMNGRPT